MHEATPISAHSLSPDVTALRQRLGTLCHFVRAMAALYLGWLFFSITRFWLDEELLIRVFSLRLQINIEGISVIQRLAGYSADMLTWLVLLGTVVSVWQLFGGFLKGSIFTVEAASHLQTVGEFGVGAVFVGFVTQPIKAIIVTHHLAAAPKWQQTLLFDPSLVLNLTFCLMVISLAHVFKTASALARDNAGFI
jgi:hypothetical protein